MTDPAAEHEHGDACESCIRCDRCGQELDGFAANGDRYLCHPDDPNKPDCYWLETHRARSTGELLAQLHATVSEV